MELNVEEDERRHTATFIHYDLYVIDRLRRFLVSAFDAAFAKHVRNRMPETSKGTEH